MAKKKGFGARCEEVLAPAADVEKAVAWIATPGDSDVRPQG